MRTYLCELPIYGTGPVIREVNAPNAREARKTAAAEFDRYWNRDRMPGDRMQKTPASHWTARRID